VTYKLNYTQKKSSCEVNYTPIIDKSSNYVNTDKKSSKKQSGRSCASPKVSSALLGNREVGCKPKKIDTRYIKFYNKQIFQYALTVGNITDRTLEKRRLEKTLSKAEFKLKLENDKQIKKINQSLCSCGRDMHFMNEDKIVDIKENNGKRRFSGVKSCGNNASCPVCAAKLSAIRGNQLKELMEVGRNNGRSYILVVPTIPHRPLEALEITQNQIIDMPRFIFQENEWRDFRELTKCRFLISGLENMISFKDGLVDWHPHKNYLLDFDIKTSEILEILGLNTEIELSMYISEMMTRLGQKYLDKEKIKKTLRPVRYVLNKTTNKVDVKGGITATLDFQDDYIAKWGLDAEMTASIYKKGRYEGSADKNGEFKKSFHPFGLADLIDENNKETSEKFKYQCIKAFQEFVLASKGKKWFYFGKNQVKYYNDNYGSKIKVKKDEFELLELEDNGNIFDSLSEEEWLMFEYKPRKEAIAFSHNTNQEVLEYIYTEIEKNRIKIAENYNCRISTYLRQRKKNETV